MTLRCPTSEAQTWSGAESSRLDFDFTDGFKMPLLLVLSIGVASQAGVCPANCAECPGSRGGCAPIEAGMAVDCCGDGTACGTGYTCGQHTRPDTTVPEPACIARTWEASAANDTPLPMGTAGWQPRYNLCDPLWPDAESWLLFLDLGDGLRFPYYSNVGPLAGELAGVELALIAQHGAGRNADDYFCSAAKAANMSKLAGRVAVFAPRFMQKEDSAPVGVAWWNESYPNGCWRCGGQSDPSASSSGATVSSFEILDRMVGDLLRTARRLGARSSLRAITIAGHSSGGQIVQRHAIYSHVEPPDIASAGVQLRHVPANPSSYAYLDARRWVHNWSELRVPDDAMIASCPTYNAWHFGLEGGLPPYVNGTPGGNRAAIERFGKRDVVYLHGHNDTCPCNPGDAGCRCDSHDLEVTCADEIGGPFRLKRGRLYFEALQTVFGTNGSTHALYEVANVGHDHAMIWQSDVGLHALFEF